MQINDFDGANHYFKFALAKGFVTAQGEFPYQKNWMETWGGRLVAPSVSPLDLGLKNIKNPIVIVALAVTAIVAVTIIFYTAEFFALFPFLKLITPGAVKLALFTLSETTIAGLGLRTFGRLSNEELMGPWRRREVAPLPLGAVIPASI